MKNTLSASATPGRLRRQITSVLLTLSLSVGMIAATATPAQSAGGVVGCFRPSRPGYSLWDMPVQFQVYYNGFAYKVGDGKLGPNGCTSYVVPPQYRGYYLRMSLNYPISNMYRWTGNSPWAPDGQLQYNLGTSVAYCSGC